jgi:hypothetical protein
VRIFDNFIEKVGQIPTWSIEPPESLQKVLGDHLSEYKKGMVNESQGYGIGAFAYYRRIVETIIGQLLDDIGELIKDEPDHKDYMGKLANVMESKSAENRIAVVKDLLPSVLRQGGMNPLAELHDALSQGMHAKTDEECLEYAAMVRECLVFLVEEVSARKKRAQGYVASMHALKEKLAKKGKTKTHPK